MTWIFAVMEKGKTMSVDKWAYDPKYCTGYCCGDCDLCNDWKNRDEEEEDDYEKNIQDLRKGEE